MREDALKWVILDIAGEPRSEFYCPTRDVADGRLSKLFIAGISAGLSENNSSLLAAIAGELASNCFDHNLGAWPDITGCWFSFTNTTNGLIVLVADRGQGILKSLQRADSRIISDKQALNIALTEQLSGRKPERRGRGLKFVVNALENQFSNSVFQLFSGNARFAGKFPLDQKIVEYIKTDQVPIHGTFALLEINVIVK